MKKQPKRLALAIIGAFCMGVYMSDLPFSPTRLKLYNWHKWAGVTILALSLPCATRGEACCRSAWCRSTAISAKAMLFPCATRQAPSSRAASSAAADQPCRPGAR